MSPSHVFTTEELAAIFPPARTEAFFEALFGGAEEGAYDIVLAPNKEVAGKPGEVSLVFELKKRPGKCLACNLTSGLPEVFKRHPILNVKGVAAEVARIAGFANHTYEVGKTKEYSDDLHVIPLTVQQGV